MMEAWERPHGLGWKNQWKVPSLVGCQRPTAIFAPVLNQFEVGSWGRCDRGVIVQELLKTRLRGFRLVEG